MTGIAQWRAREMLAGFSCYEDAVRAGKQGLMIYFGQKYCVYCKLLLEGNFGKPDILDYTQKHFDVIGIDIHGQREVTALDGSQWNERGFSVNQNINFTPTLTFFDERGKEILRLDSVVQFYRLRNVLDYVTSGAYRHYATFQQWRNANKR